MQSIKNDFSAGLDLDNSPYRVALNAYTDALNITKDAVEGSNDRVITNIVGNRPINYTLPAGTNKCIGAFPFTLRNTIIYFVYNSNGYHLILEFNNTTRSIVPILSNLTDTDDIDILGFTINNKINSVNVYPRETEGDLLFFLDSLGRPTGFNIASMKAGMYNPVTRDIIDVAKQPPLSPPSCIYDNDATTRSNSLRNRLFRFKYRFVYDDLYKSTFSPISKVPLPSNILDETYTNIITNNNVITLALNNGGKEVKSIEVGMSYVEKTNDWSDFLLLPPIDKSGIGLSYNSNVSPGTTGESLTNIYFNGSAIAGTRIKVYMTYLGTTDQLIADYTILTGDTLSAALTIVASQMAGSGYLISAIVPSTNTILMNYVNATVAFSRVEITNALLPDNSDFSLSFYNDGSYPTIDIAESIELFDLVPDKANAQQMGNGNILTYWGITEGYDKDLVPNVVLSINTLPEGGGNGSGNITGSYKQLHGGPATNTFQVTVNGIPPVGTIINIKFKRLSDSAIVLAATYTTALGDTTNEVITGLYNSMATLGLANPTLRSTYQFEFVFISFVYNFYSLEINPPTVSSAPNSISTNPFSTAKKIGLVYYDKWGKSNGVLYDAKITFPAYSENGTQQVMLPYINAKIFHTPPDWAYSYQWVMTKENTQFIYWSTVAVNTDEAQFIYFDVSNFPLNASKFPTTAAVDSWTFQDGDRMRLIRRASDDTVYTDDYDAEIQGFVVDPKINGVSKTGTYLKIKKFAPFSTVDYTSNFFVIQIYRPSQQNSNSNDQVYYEYGEEYRIIEPTLTTRHHAGMVTDQDLVNVIPAEFNFYDGDVYFRKRTIILTETGYSTFNVLDRNFVDIYISAVNSIDGRPWIIDTNAKKAYYSTMVRFGQAYQSNTNINGLNRFYSNDFDEYDLSYGDIMRVSVRNRYFHVFQKYKVGNVPIYNQISKNADGKQLLVVTDKLLNPIQYYNFDAGIGDNSESLASFGFADYFTTNVKGYICRLSNDGVQPISLLYRINSFANDELPLRTGNYKVYGAFDQRLSNYICALEATETNPPYTLLFNENSNTFDSFVSYNPEMMSTLGILLVSFKDGQIWTHDSDVYNNFFGVQYPSKIEPVFNQAIAEVKSFMAYEEKSNNVWECPEIETSLMSYGDVPQQSNLVASDFKLKEGKWCAAFLRDKNSVKGLNSGDQLKGDWIKIKMQNNNASKLVSLNLVSMRFIDSPLNNK